MSALYDNKATRKRDAGIKHVRERAQEQERAPVFNPYTSSSDPERQSYYQDLERQYGELQKQLSGMDPSGFGNWITGGNERIKAARRDIENQMSNIESLLTKSKTAFSALDQQQAPELSPQMLARLEALEAESQMGPLVSDPLFQGDRATIVRGGAQALAGLGSAQKMSRFGTGGAGSVQDAYDRLGGQLAQLGQQSRAVKEQKRDVVAQAYQSYDDAVRQFENASANAEAAIISGNMEAAAVYMEQASQAEQQMRMAQANVNQAISGNLIGSAVQVGAAAMGSPTAKKPTTAMQAAQQSMGRTTPSSGGSYLGNQYGLGVQLPDNFFQPMKPVATYK